MAPRTPRPPTQKPKLARSRGAAKSSKVQSSKSSIADNPALKAVLAIAEKNRTDSPLLRLPGDIRNQIYKHVFANQRIQVRSVGPKFTMKVKKKKKKKKKRRVKLSNSERRGGRSCLGPHLLERAANSEHNHGGSSETTTHSNMPSVKRKASGPADHERQHPCKTSSVAAHDNITERNRKCSPFLRLPSEIRNRIYEYIFGGNMIRLDGDVVIGPNGYDQSNWLNLSTPTLVCRDVYNETKLVPWSCNCFRLYPHHLYYSMWIERVTAEMRSAVRTVEFYIGYVAPNHSLLGTMPIAQKHFPGIKTVYVHVSRGWHGRESRILLKEHVLELARKHGWHVIFQKGFDDV